MTTWQDDLRSAQSTLMVAMDRAKRAQEQRARVVAAARKAGASYGEIAKVLGVSRPTVVDLARLGERLGG